MESFSESFLLSDFQHPTLHFIHRALLSLITEKQTTSLLLNCFRRACRCHVKEMVSQEMHTEQAVVSWGWHAFRC